ncbi:MAG: hypothetical protein INH41_00830 [Myxococcaceae bacterium]|nr:hypothetical protein [Myxococcaceae bacterium]MCA3010922.1 hypothetical protein [Myxococcaceae bacterium]
MSHVPWREAYRQATERPPPGAKARVWRAMAAPPRGDGRRWWAPAFAAAMATGALLVLALWPKPVTGSALGDGYALFARGATYSVEGRQVSLRRGRLAVSVWGAPLRVDAGGQRVEVESAVAVFEMAGEQMRVLPVDGVVLVEGARVRATSVSRTAAGDVGPLLALEPAEAPLSRAEVVAAAAVEAGAWDEAVAAYALVAASTSLRAEVALLKRGELELRQLSAPARARATFDEAASRFPTGALALERSLSALEAAAALSDWSDVDRRAQAFEATFPASERLAEVRRARALALYALHQVDAACRVAQHLRQPVPFSPQCPADER